MVTMRLLQWNTRMELPLEALAAVQWPPEKGLDLEN